MDGHTLLIVLILAAGTGMFLRLVAKEKHRRERHLELRLQEKVKELENELLRQQGDKGMWSADDEEPVVIAPADDEPADPVGPDD